MATLQEIENDRLVSRAKVTIDVGDYVLVLDPVYFLFNVKRRDGGKVPRALEGKYRTQEDFRNSAEKFHGPSYSVEGLLGRASSIAAAARRAGIDPKAIGIEEGQDGRDGKA